MEVHEATRIDFTRLPDTEDDRRLNPIQVERARRVQGFQGNQVVDVHHGINPVEVFSLRDPPHQGLVRASAAGWIVSQGSVGIPQGLDRSELTGLVHRHSAKPGGDGLDLLPQGVVVLGIANAGRDAADDHLGNLGFRVWGDGERKHQCRSAAKAPARTHLVLE